MVHYDKSCAQGVISVGWKSLFFKEVHKHIKFINTALFEKKLWSNRLECWSNTLVAVSPDHYGQPWAQSLNPVHEKSELANIESLLETSVGIFFHLHHTT